MKRLLSIKETSEYLGISEKTLYNWVSQRKIPFVKLSHKCLKFDILQLDRIIKENSLSPLENIDTFKVR
jgi:excisionase family DNA binding protein